LAFLVLRMVVALDTGKTVSLLGDLSVSF
jgi:hypothetical protein